MILKKIGITLLVIAAIALFIIPIAIDWGWIDPRYMDGLFLLNLGCAVFSIPCLFLSQFD